MSGTLNRWTARQKVSASHLNEMWDLGAQIAAMPGFNFYREGTDQPLVVGPFRQGRVVAAGPAGEADWPDERYWIEDVFIEHISTDTERSRVSLQAVGAEVEGDYTAPGIKTVTNWPEILEHTHTLAVNTPVLYVELQDAMYVSGSGGPTGQPNRRFAMCVLALPQGQYQGTVLQNVVDGHWGADFVASSEDFTPPP